MNPHLDKEIIDALHTSSGDVHVVDPTTQRVYVLVECETHLQAMEALRKQQDWDSIQQGAIEAEAGEGISLDEADRKLRAELGFPDRA